MKQHDFLRQVRIAIVVSQFNQNITDLLLDGTVSQLSASGVTKEQIRVFKVPGAIEIPLIAKLLARSKEYSAIICLGAVIRGETDHYDYVCQQVSQGCQQVMMEFEIPVIFGVLTTDTIAQAQDRVGGAFGHKGHEAADAAIDMIMLIDQLPKCQKGIYVS